MLRELDIRDMVLIDRLSMTFEPGLNVLTGETGAGKSILLDCLGFVLGWRGRANLVREGADRGEVTAVFELPMKHPALEVLQDAGFDFESDLILRRTVTPEGRKTAYINDRRASGDTLRQISETLVELHGQHDDRGLLNPRGHRALLDDFAGLEEKRSACRTAWSSLKAVQQAFHDAQEQVSALKEEEDFLRHATQELASLSPEVGEEAELDRRRRLMQAGAKVGEDIGRASMALGFEGAEGKLSDATRWIEGAAQDIGASADQALSALSRTMNELGDAAALIDQLAKDLDVDPRELELVEDRLFAIRGLARKHKCLADELPDLFANYSARLETLDHSGSQLEGLEADVANAGRTYDICANDLRSARKVAAKELDKSIANELSPLKMERANFETRFEPSDPGPDGIDAVEFTVSTNPGTPAGPLSRIASGGELSRFMLALKVCLSRQSGSGTLIFDEIDRGVGGATADAVGRRLARLSQDLQVLCVTHSPQVAALGSHHWMVAKDVGSDQTISRVTQLDERERVEELARMLSGDRVTEAARAAAKELLGVQVT